ncbi:MAG TPA: hypothetical protein VMW15_16240 [Terracidiphilus sp.]|jgi:hypothetical protein|nr:hypothetical protein [Terracidiphilus sp.]
MAKMILPVSLLTLACTCWLAVMEMVLRHAGYVERMGMALAIAAICAVTIAAPDASSWLSKRALALAGSGSADRVGWSGVCAQCAGGSL